MKDTFIKSSFSNEEQVCVAIMQPYFFPYIGYFQLIAKADVFVVYDNIKYTKKGWINRNRILVNEKDIMFTLPLKKDSDSLDVSHRELSANFKRNKLLGQIRGAYNRAPYFKDVFPLIESIVACENENLFEFLYNSIIKVCEYLMIITEIRVSSSININHDLKGAAKVLALCEALNANSYVNAIGGMDLYSVNEFEEKSIDLKFIKSRPFEYVQFDNDFIPWLSIIDVMMFNSREDVNKIITEGFDLI